jgi:ribosomal protein S18 acetylase RimI-like enzyme
LVDSITVGRKVASMEPYRLSEEHAEAAGDLIAAAFFPSAVAAFLYPNTERRGRRQPTLFAAITRLAVRHGEATALGSPPHAVALWLYLDREPLTEADYAAAGMGDVDALLDAGETERVAALTGHMGDAHTRVMDGPHWYLPFLAVAPVYHGQGVGSLLMRHALDRASAAGLPCYLDSADERNLRFYGRLGFRVVETGVVPGSHLRTWALRRD